MFVVVAQNRFETLELIHPSALFDANSLMVAAPLQYSPKYDDKTALLYHAVPVRVTIQLYLAAIRVKHGRWEFVQDQLLLKRLQQKKDDQFLR